MIKSVGGKIVQVGTHSGDVSLTWREPGCDGDMLLSPKDARALADWLRQAADLAETEVPSA